MKSLSYDAPSWPDPTQRLLLRACLAEDAAEAETAWRAWRGVQDFDGLDLASMRLMPLLLRQVVRFGWDDPNTGRYRGLQRWGWVRSQQIFRRLGELSQGLGTEGIPILLLKGAPVAELYYRDHALRPMGDGDLLVPHARATDAIRWVAAQGWTARPEKDPATLVRFHLRQNHSWGFAHGDGQEIDLHWKLLHLGVDPGLDDRFWKGSCPFVLQGREFRTLSTTHHLFHAMVHGVPLSRVPGLRWIVDSMAILRNAGAGVDWGEFVGCVRDFHVGVVVRHALGYLVSEHGAPIPAEVLGQVGALSDEPWQWAEFRILTNYPPSLHPVYLWSRYQRERALVPSASQAGAIDGYLRFVCIRWELDRRREIPAEFARKGRMWVREKVKEIWRARGPAFTRG